MYGKGITSNEKAELFTSISNEVRISEESFIKEIVGPVNEVIRVWH